MGKTNHEKCQHNEIVMVETTTFYIPNGWKKASKSDAFSYNDYDPTSQECIVSCEECGEFLDDIVQ